MTTDRTALEPRLSLASVVAFGLSYMTPGLAMVIFGVIAAASAGTAPTAFLLATAAMFLTALSYAKMARRYPVSGSAYFYARKLLGSRIGFFVGWSVLLDYLFMPMVSWILQGVYLNVQFPAVPIWGWILINACLATFVNIIGVILSDRVNKTLTVVSVLLVLLFIAYCLVHLGNHPPASLTAPFWNDDTGLSAVSTAAAVAAFSYLGFDAVTTLSEETHDAQRNIPRAVVLVIATGGVLFAIVAYIMQLVHPGGLFGDPQTVAYTMSIEVGGKSFADWTNIATLFSGFAAGIAVQLSSSRLLYFMGRDGVLPKRIFGSLNARTKTPIPCLLVTGAMCFIGLDLDLQTATSFVNFGAFLGFTAVNVCVIAYFLRNRHTPGVGVFGYAIFPALGAVVTVYMLTQLSTTAQIIGVCWLAVGVAYLLWLTRGFSRPTPEPSMGGSAPAPGRQNPETALGA